MEPRQHPARNPSQRIRANKAEHLTKSDPEREVSQTGLKNVVWRYLNETEKKKKKVYRNGPTAYISNESLPDSFLHSHKRALPKSSMTLNHLTSDFHWLIGDFPNSLFIVLPSHLEEKYTEKLKLLS